MDALLTKIEALKEKAGADLSVAEDLSIAVMNLISLEEHCFFSGVKTDDGGYFDTAQQIRELRKDLLAQLMPTHEAETWCMSKHLLAATMRITEVGNKLKSEGRDEDAKRMFDSAYKVYSIFWALKLKLVTPKTVEDQVSRSSRLEDLVTQLANCCDE